ncbi:MAG: hypothetical protein IPP07_21670 [Holophagales bacterium]|nr:hypothetical protein [Holophagales bacterium]
MGQALHELGFDVRLSHQYFNAQRQRPGEIDILATRSFTDDTENAGKVHRTLELVIECKDSRLPYVLFGFPASAPKPTRSRDGEIHYNKLRSLQDKFENYLALLSRGDENPLAAPAVMSRHHQFSTPYRFHQAAAVELRAEKPKGDIKVDKLKLGVSERLRDSLHGLAAYLRIVQRSTFQEAEALRANGYRYDPALWMTFFLLVHRTDHYRYTLQSGLSSATHTTLFTSLQDEGESFPYLVDFVAFPGLAAAVAAIDSTFHAVTGHAMGFLEHAPNPRTRRA